ncbi:MAG TPA: amino acid ABC transporter permease [Caproiciproducens sp.]|nr:amino acid ABC transporter permease [Caproiciproducens sp.]
MGKIFDVQFMIESIPAILTGIPDTLSIAFVAFAMGTVIGFAGALVKIYRVPVLRRMTDVYVSFVRGTPLIVQIFLIYYGIPILLRIINQKFGTNLDVSQISATAFMFVAFSLNAGAYLTETIRSAILAVDKGQMEAAYSVGMGSSQAMVRIILPQALKVGLPNISNSFIGLLKDTSLAFAASVSEIMGQAKIVAGRASRFFEAYIVAAVIYWIICILFEQVVKRVEAQVRKNEKGVSV